MGLPHFMQGSCVLGLCQFNISRDACDSHKYPSHFETLPRNVLLPPVLPWWRLTSIHAHDEASHDEHFKGSCLKRTGHQQRGGNCKPIVDQQSVFPGRKGGVWWGCHWPVYPRNRIQVPPRPPLPTLAIWPWARHFLPLGSLPRLIRSPPKALWALIFYESPCCNILSHRF